MRSENPVVLRVFPAPNGRWYVVEVAFRKPLTDFVTRHAAEKYAASVAKIKARATVELYGRGGRLEARTSYPPIEAPEPASVELAAKDGNRWLSLEPTQDPSLSVGEGWGTRSHRLV